MTFREKTIASDLMTMQSGSRIRPVNRRKRIRAERRPSKMARLYVAIRSLESPGQWRITRAGQRPPQLASIVRQHGVAIVGTLDAIEDALDVLEADQRLDDPANRERIPRHMVELRLGREGSVCSEC